MDQADFERDRILDSLSLTLYQKECVKCTFKRKKLPQALVPRLDAGQPQSLRDRAIRLLCTLVLSQSEDYLESSVVSAGVFSRRNRAPIWLEPIDLAYATIRLKLIGMPEMLVEEVAQMLGFDVKAKFRVMRELKMTQI